MDIILEKIPTNVDLENIQKEVLSLEGVLNIHHVHIWTIEGNFNYLTAHVYIDKNLSNDAIEKLKKEIKHKLTHLNINHSTLEFEISLCNEEVCDIKPNMDAHQFHHHHHHH